jgi:hypothetical protein
MWLGKVEYVGAVRHTTSIDERSAQLSNRRRDMIERVVKWWAWKKHVRAFRRVINYIVKSGVETAYANDTNLFKWYTAGLETLIHVSNVEFKRYHNKGE